MQRNARRRTLLFAVTTLTLHASDSDAGATSATVTISADSKPGDLIVLNYHTDNSNYLPANEDPLDFTSIGYFFISPATPASKMSISAKLADDGDPGRDIYIDGGNASDNISLFEFRGNNRIKSFAAQDYAEEGAAGNPAAQVCNASLGAVPLIVLGAYGNESNVTTSTFSTTADGTLDTVELISKYKIYNSSPADTTIDMDDDGARNMLASCYIEVS